ncbi:MAG: hypothetical protein ACI90V_012186, partial [Bacillariaceae sp.]|jgi:hypothetical protein
VIDYDDQNVQTKIIDTLVNHLDTSSRGLVMGGDEYDRVGNTIWSNRNAIKAISDVSAATQIANEDITIVLLYEHPRVEQWLSIYTHKITATEIDNDSNFKDAYEEFLCNPDTYDERFETLETAMNPFKLATTYLKAGGYNVVMIDLDGVRDAGLMIEHVIGCEVLGGTCSNAGWLDTLESESFMKYQKSDDEAAHPFHSLTPNDVQDLERLLRLRDCNYQNILKDHPNFRILYEKSIFNSCPTTTNDVVVTDLQDTTKLFNAIQSQKKCNNDPVSLPIMFENILDVDDTNLSKYSDGTANVVPVVVENNDESGEDDQQMSEEIKNEKHPLSYVIQIVFASTILLWVGFMLRVQWKKNRDSKYTQGGVDGIMPSISEDRNRPISEIM